MCKAICIIISDASIDFASGMPWLLHITKCRLHIDADILLQQKNNIKAML